MQETGFAVVVRIRPYNKREQNTSNDPLLTVVDDKTVLFDPKKPGKRNRFLMGKDRRKSWYARFDRLFDSMSTQQDVYNSTARMILDDVLNGYNATVFAYGATGSGKTYSMVGTLSEPGVMVRSVNELFKRIQRRKHIKYSLSISYLEIYNEEVRDLLVKKKTGRLALRQTKQGVVVANLSKRVPRLASEVLQWLAEGNRMRTKCRTDLNAESSRSHAVLQINVRGRDPTNDSEIFSKLSLIDLAGSERGQKGRRSEKIATEGANINQSLLSLGNCITALVKNANSTRKHHIPFRDSKLTLLLKDSLGGNCRSVMIVNVSPSRLSYQDSYNTLKYADCFKQIKVKMKSNRRSIPQDLANFKKTIKEKNGIIALKEMVSYLQDSNEEEYDQLVKETAEKDKQHVQAIQKLKGKVQRLVADKESLKAEKEKFQAEIEDLKAVTQAEGDNSKQSERKLKTELSNVKLKWKRVQKQNTTLEQEKRSLESQLEETQSNVDGKNQVLGKIENMRAKLKEARKRNDHQKSMIDQQKERIEDLEKVETSHDGTLKDNEKLRELVEVPAKKQAKGQKRKRGPSKSVNAKKRKAVPKERSRSTKPKATSKKQSSKVQKKPPKKSSDDDVPLNMLFPTLSKPKHLCKTCRKSFKSADTLCHHIRRSHSTETFACDFPACQESFPCREYLKLHEISHLPPTYKCKCGHGPCKHSGGIRGHYNRLKQRALRHPDLYAYDETKHGVVKTR